MGALAAAALAAAWPAPVLAWDRITEVGGDGPPELAERRFEPVAGLADAQGIVVLGNRARAWGPPAAEALAIAAILPEDQRRRASGRLYRLAGDVIAGIDDCAVTGLAGDGEVRWRWQPDLVMSCISAPVGDSGLAVGYRDGNGVRLVALDQHGVEAWSLDFDPQNYPQGLHLGSGAREDGLALVMTRVLSGAWASVRRLDAEGRELWHEFAPLAPANTVRTVPLPERRLRVYQFSSAQAWATEFSTTGTMQTAPSTLLDPGERIDGYGVGRDGNLYAVVVDNAVATLVAWRGPQRIWSSALPGSVCGNACSLEVDVAGDVVVAGRGVNERQVLLSRYDRSTGALMGTHSEVLPSGYPIRELILLGEPAPDVLAYAFSAAPDWTVQQGDPGWIEGVRLLRRDGQALASHDLRQGKALPLAASALIADDGAIALAHRTGSEGLQLQRFGPDDSMAWSEGFERQTAPPVWSKDVPIGMPGRCADGGICVIDGADLRALGEQSGATLWRTPLAASTRIETEAWPGGRSLVVAARRISGFPGPQPPSPYWSQQHVQVFGPTGALETQVTPGTLLPVIGQRADLGVLALAGLPSAAVHRWPSQLPLLPILPLRTVGASFGRATAALIDDEVVLLMEDQPPGLLNAWRYHLVRSRDGGVRWQVPLDLVTPAGDQVRRYAVLPAVDGGVVAYLETGSAPAQLPAVDARARLVRVDADGSVRWARRFDPAPFVEAWATLEGGRLLLAGRRPHGQQLVLLALDAADGSTLALEDPPCPRHDCGANHVHLLSDGTVRALGTGHPDGAPYPLLTRTGLFDPAPAIGLNQAGLAGAWFAPYTAGQGFTLRLFSGDGGHATVFMPWFTFDVGEAGGPGSLRWYALQGDVAAGDAEATLAIVERRGGVFGSEPATAPAVVGQARLRFGSCTSGLLDYRFDGDHNGGAEGSIALQPLLPRAAPCTQADGQVLPAQASYDPALSGHWFDPARDGQGLELARIAPGAGDGGLLYGAWFTFDPTPAGNAPDDQHWFTLQGQEALDGGGVRSTLVQTLGGRFDSEPASAPFRVGEADLLPGPDCSALTLRYRFDDVAAAGDFRGLSGELQLRRLGACPDP